MNRSLIIALGSNIEPKEENLLTAMKLLKSFFKLIDLSPIYLSDPVDYLDQDDFLNMVARFETPSQPPLEVLKILKSIELEMKREKFIDKGPRNIDLDIIFYDDLSYADADLIIPHPSWQNRNFVVFPLLDLNLSKEFKLFIEPFARLLKAPQKTN